MSERARESELPPAAVQALLRGQKIEAIKIVREQRATGLKEAKHMVDRYVAADPSLAARMRSNQVNISGAQLFRFVAIVALLVAAYLWWNQT